MDPSRETKVSGETNGDREIIIFSCSADHEQDWQPYPVYLYSAILSYDKIIRNKYQVSKSGL